MPVRRSYRKSRLRWYSPTSTEASCTARTTCCIRAGALTKPSTRLQNTIRRKARPCGIVGMNGDVPDALAGQPKILGVGIDHDGAFVVGEHLGIGQSVVDNAAIGSSLMMKISEPWRASAWVSRSASAAMSSAG